MLNLYSSDGDIVDEAIVIYFKAPNSYTCEDIIEFQVHGGLVVSTIIVDEVVKLGARVANAGEFTKRAVLNGRIDLTRAEAAAKLIESRSVAAAKILSRQLNGELEDFVNRVRDDLVEILAFIEVNIDYAEEDLPDDLLDQIKDRLDSIYILLNKIVQDSKSKEGLIDGFKVSIIGRPNVGKSSLLNSLLRYDRAIISDIAGTTRDTVEETLKVGTRLVKFIDTAGIRDTKDKIEKIGIKKTVKAIKEADIIVAMFDGSLKSDDDDIRVVKLLKRFKSTKKIIAVLNKSDLELNFDSTILEEFDLVRVSCKESVKVIEDKISMLLESQSSSDDLILISRRQIDAVSNSLTFIEESFELLKDGELELFSYNINESIKSIASITTAFERDEILDKMFGSFCLGK